MAEEQDRTDEDDALKEIYERLYLENNRDMFFIIPFAIRNHYKLEGGDGLLCEIVELMRGDKREKVGKNTLIDVFNRMSDSYIDEAKIARLGYFSRGVVDEYKLRQYEYILLRVKKAIKKQ